MWYNQVKLGARDYYDYDIDAAHKERKIHMSNMINIQDCINKYTTIPITINTQWEEIKNSIIRFDKDNYVDIYYSEVYSYYDIEYDDIWSKSREPMKVIKNRILALYNRNFITYKMSQIILNKLFETYLSKHIFTYLYKNNCKLVPKILFCDLFPLPKMIPTFDDDNDNFSILID